MAGSLDRDTSPVIHLVLAAVDGGTPQLSATVTITINLSDVNDNPPRFTKAPYTASISESAFVGASVVTVTAIDPDAPGPRSEVRYYFQDDANAHFTINAVSGLIQTAKLLDREQTAKYNLVVGARDQDPDPASCLSSVAMVTVLIGDINDNLPVFTSSPVVGGLAENAVNSTIAVTLSATDRDQGQNAALTYRIFGADSAMFRVDPATGVVRFIGAVGSISFVTKRFYNMTARATDSGGR